MKITTNINTLNWQKAQARNATVKCPSVKVQYLVYVMWRAKPFGQGRELLYICTHSTADVIRVDLWKRMQAEKLKIILTSTSDNLNISQILFWSSCTRSIRTKNLHFPKKRSTTITTDNTRVTQRTVKWGRLLSRSNIQGSALLQA